MHPRLLDPAPLAGDGRRARRWPRSASGISRACRSTPCPTSPTCRCRSTRRAGLFAAGSRAAHHLSDRDRDGRPAEARVHALAVALRAVARSRSSSRTAPTSTSRGSWSTSGSSRRKDQLPAGIETGDGADLDGPRRDLHVRRWRRSPARRSRTAAPTRRPTCATSRTGSSSRSCATCRAWSRSTRSAASRSSSTSLPDPAKLMAYGLELPRRHGGAGGEQRQCRRRLHRAQRRAVSGPHARPGRGHRRRSATSSSARATACRSASRDVAEVEEGKDCAPAPRRYNGQEIVLGTAMHADRREQPHGRAARRRAS